MNRRMELETGGYKVLVGLKEVIENRKTLIVHVRIDIYQLRADVRGRSRDDIRSGSSRF